MSSLTTLEKQPFEELLGMGGGYVLDFTNHTFAGFFAEHKKDIESGRYDKHGTSKAKRLRRFWELEDDGTVAKVMSGLVDYWEYKNPKPDAKAVAQVKRCRQVIRRLGGANQSSTDSTEDNFMSRDYRDASIRKVPIDPNLVPILEARFDEAIRCLKANTPLSTVFMCGSILEGLLLGTALVNMKKFNQAKCTPKDKATGKPKPYQEWSLAQFIDVACELKFLKVDVKKFSHELREFRNYIHPYQQMSSQFAPDKHTAEICLQVLRAAIANLSGQRK